MKYASHNQFDIARLTVLKNEKVHLFATVLVFHVASQFGRLKQVPLQQSMADNNATCARQVALVVMRSNQTLKECMEVGSEPPAILRCTAV